MKQSFLFIVSSFGLSHKTSDHFDTSCERLRLDPEDYLDFSRGMIEDLNNNAQVKTAEKAENCVSIDRLTKIKQ